MQDTSLDAWDKIYCDGTLGAMYAKALKLVEENPDKTVKELLQIGVDEGVYPYLDRNLIAPRLTGLVGEGLIVRPFKRACTENGNVVLVHRLAPESWREKYRKLQQYGIRKIVKNRLEIESKTKSGTYHTVIEWHDGTRGCTCNKEYGRPMIYKCHHINGMKKATTGIDDDEKETEK